MIKIRESIKKGSFEKFKNNFFKNYRFNEQRGKFSYS
jgi:queuine/archaeosine tRNA-ribosyltransferase